MRFRNRARGGHGSPEQGPAPGGPTHAVRLGEMQPGSSGVISRIECRRQLRRRLMDMGVVSGTRLKVERVAPLGDPMELKLNGFNLSLRRDEACDIWVEVPCE